MIKTSSSSKQLFEKCISKSKKPKHQQIYIFLKTNINLLYKICEIGQNIYTNKKDNCKYCQQCKHLETLKNIINENPILGYLKYKKSKNIQTILEENKCDKNIGVKIINIFCYYWSLLEKENSNEIKYDPVQTGITFDIVNNKFDAKFLTSAFYDVNAFAKLYTLFNDNSSIISKNINVKAKYFNKHCNNDAYLATFDSIDNWDEIPAWRLVILDNFYFDLYFVLGIIYFSINKSKNYNPYPEIPKNPFSNNDFSIEAIETVAKIVDNNNLSGLPQSLIVYLNTFKNYSNVKTEFIEQVVENMKNNGLRWSKYCETNPIPDSINNITVYGFWTKETKMTKCEELLNFAINNYTSFSCLILNAYIQQNTNKQLFHKDQLAFKLPQLKDNNIQVFNH